MKVSVKITDHESKNNLSDPPPSGSYCWLITHSDGTESENTGTAGLQLRLMVVASKKEEKDHHKKSAFFTFWLTDKTMGRFRNFMDQVKIQYSDDSFEEKDFIGKTFRGRCRTYEDDYGVKTDLVTWKDLTDDEKKIVDPLAVRLTGKDLPPVGMGKSNGSGSNGSGTPTVDAAADEYEDEDGLPF